MEEKTEKENIMSDGILGIDGQTIETNKIPKVKAVHPFGSKVLVECVNNKELIDTNLFIPEDTAPSDAPQAYILELGPALDEKSGLEVGQRIYWEGKGLAVNDPRSEKSGRVVALLEVHNVRGIIEEECCGGGTCCSN